MLRSFFHAITVGKSVIFASRDTHVLSFQWEVAGRAEELELEAILWKENDNVQSGTMPYLSRV